MSRLRFHPLLVVLLLGCPQSVKSQEIQIGAPPIGVQASLGHDAYSVIGTSAQSILDQLEANGWTRFSVAYRYRWKNEPVPLTNGMPSNKCRPFDFEILFDFTTRYPQWDRPPDAIPELIAAWDAFAAEVEAQWEQYRDDVVGRGRAVARRLRRFEDDCAFVSDRVREQVREQMDERDPITAQEPRLRIQWPPEGHIEVLREERIANREAARGERTAEGRARDSEAGTPDASSGRALPVTEPAVFPAASIDLAFSMDLADGATGLVVDLHHLGNPQFREAIGTAEPGNEAALTPDAVFDFPGFTDVFVSTVLRALAYEGEVDLDADLSTYLPDLTPGLARTTLRQLVDQRAGLDNAIVPDTADWNEVLDDLDDRALFTEAGALFSYSRFSYPLIVRVLDTTFERPFEELIAERVFGPLGMTRSGFGARDALDARDGLPLTRTTVGDLERFWSAWLDGDIQGSGPDALSLVQADPNAWDGRTYTGGLWFDRVGTAPRLSLMCGAAAVGHSAGVQVFPETRTIMTFWGRYDLAEPEGHHPPPSANRWPKESVRFVLSRVAGALGLTDEVYRPTMLTGGGQPGRAARSCAEPSVSQSRIEEFGPRVPAAEWPGRYVNGDWFFQLVAMDDGMLGSPVDPSRAPFSVRHYGGNIYFTNMDLPGGPDIGFPLRLIRDASGRRYVMLGDRAYLHEDDRPGA